MTKIIFWLTTFSLFILFGYIVYLNIKILREVGAKKGFENCYNYHDIKGRVKRLQAIEADNIIK